MRSRSAFVIAALRYISKNDVHVEHLRRADNRYIAPLLRDKLVIRNGTKLVITQSGFSVLDLYESRRLPPRKQDGEIAESVKALLHYSKLHVMRKSA